MSSRSNRKNQRGQPAGSVVKLSKGVKSRDSGVIKGGGAAGSISRSGRKSAYSVSRSK